MSCHYLHLVRWVLVRACCVLLPCHIRFAVGRRNHRIRLVTVRLQPAAHAATAPALRFSPARTTHHFLAFCILDKTGEQHTIPSPACLPLLTCLPVAGSSRWCGCVVRQPHSAERFFCSSCLLAPFCSSSTRTHAHAAHTTLYYTTHTTRLGSCRRLV